DQEDDRDDRKGQEPRACDCQPICRHEHVLLVVLAPAQAMVGRGRNQQDRRRRGAEEGDEEDVALKVRHALPAVCERDGEQEREQHLDARQRDPELVQELDQLAIELVLRTLRVVAHRKRSRSGGITTSRAVPSPRRSKPRTTAAGTPSSLPLTSSAAPASSSATAITVACSW